MSAAARWFGRRSKQPLPVLDKEEILTDLLAERVVSDSERVDDRNNNQLAILWRGGKAVTAFVWRGLAVSESPGT